MSINFLLILLSEDTLYMQCFSDNINSKFNLGDTGKKKKKTARLHPYLCRHTN